MRLRGEASSIQYRFSRTHIHLGKQVHKKREKGEGKGGGERGGGVEGRGRKEEREEGKREGKRRGGREQGEGIGSSCTVVGSCDSSSPPNSSLIPAVI